MRRFLTFVFVFVFTGLLVGCGNENKPPPAPRDSTLKPKEGEEKPRKIEPNP